jgi:plasmid replication initiation protein
MSADQAKERNQFELFLPYLADLSLRDQREMMERPFFSLAKSKRMKSIDYRSPDGKVWVNVSANPTYGMATIWDADILIYCASVLADMQRRGLNEIPRRLKLMPYDLLRAIDRPTTGRAYELLGQSLDRLTSTTVKTNIRAENRREATFNWLDGWEQIVDERTERSRGISIDLSNWFYEGVLMQGGVLAIDRAYFSLSGGRERWLYKVARKHAGGAGEAGFAISMPTLFEKSGAEGDYRRFKFEMLRIITKDPLPGYALELEPCDGRREPSVRMRRRPEGNAAKPAPLVPPPAQAPLAAPATEMSAPALVDVSQQVRSITRRFADKINAGHVSDNTRAHLATICPGWDLDQLHSNFADWLGGDAARTPVNYQAAFIGFVKRHHEKYKHTLPGW